MRCTQTGKGGYQVYAVTIRDRRGERFNVGRVFNDSQPVSQPLDRGTADEHAPFQCVVGLVSSAACDSGEQSVLGRQWFVTDVHQHETTGAIGVLGHSVASTVLAEER